MSRYKSRPRTIEAEQYFEGGEDDPVYVPGVCRCDLALEVGETIRPHVHTAHSGQRVDLEHGDYVVPEPDGRGYYPIKPDIFWKHWEADKTSVVWTQHAQLRRPTH